MEKWQKKKQLKSVKIDSIETIFKITVLHNNKIYFVLIMSLNLQY